MLWDESTKLMPCFLSGSRASCTFRLCLYLSVTCIVGAMAVCWQVEEEQSGRADLQRLVQKANSEAALWKQKCESGEGGVRSEELDEIKKKFTARLMETESQLEAALSKAASMDKANHRLRAELEDMSVEVERVRVAASLRFHVFV